MPVIPKVVLADDESHIRMMMKVVLSRAGFEVVGEAANRIATESDAFGFRVLARMARCVERAAKANDMNALRDLLPELAVAVERNRIGLTPRR